jgi:type VI secretion system secreted protein Hcp
MISAYLRLETDRAGKIKGPVLDIRDNVKNGSIALLAVEHGIVSPRDVATGMASGKRQHLPLTFTKETDGTSPFFNEFIGRNELIKTAEFFFYGQDRQPGLTSGREAIQYKITLSKAFVSKLELVGRTDVAAQESNRFPLTEKISLVYDSILWEWINPKAMAQDVFSSKS